MRHPSAVGQHHIFRGLLPAVGATLLASALLLLGAGILLDEHLGHLARDMAMRVVPGGHAMQDLNLAVGDYAVAALVAADGGDERALDEAGGKLESAARVYDGWARGAGLAQLRSMEPVVRNFEEQLAIAGSGGKIEERQLRAAVDDVAGALRLNSEREGKDALRKLKEIADCQQRRRVIEMALMGLLSVGCIGLLFFARRREERACAAEVEAIRGLEQTNADLDAFAGRVAHDLRNPLVPILSGSQMIERLSVDTKVRRVAERIGRSARRLSAMIDMLLDFSRIGGSESAVECDVPTVVDDVIEAFRERARTEGVRLEVVVSEPLRARCEPIVVASPLQNLLENAFKYGRRPDQEAVIDVRAFRQDRWVAIEVEDRGPGVDGAKAEDLFHAFSRGVVGGEGVGLGLATARRLVESRGGSLSLRPSRFGGACFEIRLPLAPLPYAAAHQEHSALQ